MSALFDDEASISPAEAENPFIVAVRGDGDNHSPVRNIRKSISLTTS